MRRWTQAKAGEGHVVLLSGEPGVGKSRLAVALGDHLQAEPHFRLSYFCSSHHQDSALYPIGAQLERAVGFERDDDPETRFQKLEALVAAASPEREDVALLAELLSIPGSERYPPLDLTPQRKREKTFKALLGQLTGLARQQPVLIVFEDLQWIDPTSRELLDIFIQRIETSPALLIATFRPEFQPPWTDLPQVTALSLNRLNRRNATTLVRLLSGDKPRCRAASLTKSSGAPTASRCFSKNWRRRSWKKPPIRPAPSRPSREHRQPLRPPCRPR